MQLIDLTGKRFGIVTVIGDAGETRNKKKVWLCKCDCGKEFKTTRDLLVRQDLPSCGCKSKKKAMYVGYKVGKLTVTKDLGINNEHKRIWECTCDCGNVVVHTTSVLNRGSIKSCGCLRHESGEKRKKYNARDRKLYYRWSNIRSRCCNPTDAAYANYGGRGIELCPEWKNDFFAFRDWAINNGYDPSLSIDRIDNNKGYSPDNCRWTTAKTQSNNRRSNHYITINGETKTLMQWSEEVGIASSTILARITTGWSDYDAVTTPLLR